MTTITITLPLDEAKTVFRFLAKNAGSTFGNEFMPVVNTMDAIAKAARDAGDPI